VTVRGISIEAYYRHMDSGKALNQWQRIYYELIITGRKLTRAELAEYMHIRMSSVCGRVHELMRAGLLVEYPRRSCGITHEQAHPVGLPELQQGELPL